jgi:uncharacterized protein with HEPN domain
MRRDDRVYLYHIADAIARASSYIAGLDESSFASSPLVQDGVIRQLEIIGEATRHLSRAFRQQHSWVRWDEMAGMRDKLIHDYFGVDLGSVWLTAREDLPKLHVEVRGLLAGLEDPSEI